MPDSREGHVKQIGLKVENAQFSRPLRSNFSNLSLNGKENPMSSF